MFLDYISLGNAKNFSLQSLTVVLSRLGRVTLIYKVTRTHRWRDEPGRITHSLFQVVSQTSLTNDTVIRDTDRLQIMERDFPSEQAWELDLSKAWTNTEPIISSNSIRHREEAGPSQEGL